MNMYQIVTGDVPAHIYRKTHFGMNMCQIVTGDVPYAQLVICIWIYEKERNIIKEMRCN